MTAVEFIDQTTRDGEHSGWGLRMEAAMAAGPVQPTYQFRKRSAELVHRLPALTTSTHVHVSRDGMALTLRRRP